VNDWWGLAACRGRPQDLWFDAAPMGQAVARAVCRSCVVRVECANYALELAGRRLLIEGTWAGVTVSPGRRRAGVDRLRAVAGRPAS
jgi:hypothetical protein